MKFFRLTICICILFPLICQAQVERPKGTKNESFKHKIQLQLSDAYGLPVSGTKFWVTLNILKENQKVTVQLPEINFITGPLANAKYEKSFLPSPISGGYLYTAASFLPKDLRPNDVVYFSSLAASNNGLSSTYSFTQDPKTFPVPPVGYIISITNAGALTVQGAGTFGNIIPAGPQVLLPTTISYFVQPNNLRVKNNFALSTGPTNTTKFTGSEIGAAGTALRDTHINDAFNGIAAWTWTDNSMISDKTNNVLNVMVAIGENKNCTFKVKKPVQLTDFPPGTFAWDTAVAINRTNQKNIVVSYAVLNSPSTPYRAVSFDGGKTWPHNGPINIQPTGPGKAGDNRGVSCDKFGNIWYSSTNLKTDGGIVINQPYFAVSSDGGITFKLIYTLPLPANDFTYDFPQYCFGGDGQGKYGLHFTADYLNTATGDLGPVVGFIPIKRLGLFGTPSLPIFLSEFTNNNLTPSITASKDGRVWYMGTPSGEGPGAKPNPGTVISTIRTVFKSPGPLDQNYAGPWDFAYINLLNEYFVPTGNEKSQPLAGYIHNSPQSNLFDDERQALYGITSAHFPDFSQDMRLYFRISRNNGQTWSNSIDISNSQCANRGFQSMALDPIKGDLYFGWYDGRNDPTYKSLEYFGAMIPSKQLDKWVNTIPPSDPRYELPSSGSPLQ